VPRGERFSSCRNTSGVFRVLLFEPGPKRFLCPQEPPEIHIIVDYRRAFKYAMKAARKLEKRGYRVTVEKDWNPESGAR
jgi:hypothetical protein